MSLTIENKGIYSLEMVEYQYQLGVNIMCTLSNFYRLLNNCRILASAADEHAYQQSVYFSLAEFIGDCNDEIYHASNFDLTFDHDAYKSLFKGQNGQIPELKVIVVLAEYLDRDTVENVIGYELDGTTGNINLKQSDGETIDLNIKAIDEYDGSIVQIYDIDVFLKNLDDSVHIDNHWITAVLHDKQNNQGLIPDEDFLKAYNVELTP